MKADKIAVGVAKILANHMLLFFTNLYTMGVNALEIYYDDQKELLQIDEFAKRRENPQLEEGKKWIENPQLHLTALYFAQEDPQTERASGSETYGTAPGRNGCRFHEERIHFLHCSRMARAPRL